MENKKVLLTGLVFFLLLLSLNACGGKTSNMPDLATQQTQIAVQQTQIAIQQTQVALNLQTTPIADNQNNNSQSEQPAISQPDSNSDIAAISPGTRLFWDDFENGIKPEWGMTGTGFSVVNGELRMENGYFKTAIIGNKNWRNYKIVFIGYDCWGSGAKSRILVRIQDVDNYMEFRDIDLFPHLYEWYRVVNGNDNKIPNTSGRLNSATDDVEIEVSGNVYRSVVHKDANKVRFIDDQYNYGGIQIEVTGNFRLDAIEIIAIE